MDCKAFSLAVLALATAPAIAAAPLLTLTVHNPNPQPLSQVLEVPLAGHSLPAMLNSDGGDVDLQDKDGDGKADTLLVWVTLPAKGQQTVNISQGNAKPAARTHAELSVRQGGQWQGQKYVADGFTFKEADHYQTPPQLTDHSFYLRYEGPGWESDKIGYRLYLDWRNASDVFGKRTSDMVLKDVGQDGYESYHHLSDWGMDVLKVGKSLGIGSLGRFTDQGVAHFEQVKDSRYALEKDGGLRSAFKVHYQGWEVAGENLDVDSRYQIDAGSHASQVTVSTRPATQNLVTGLVKLPATELLKGGSGDWHYLATWGKQSLSGKDDNLGLALFYKGSEVAQVSEGEHDHLLRFKATDKPIHYYLMSYWPDPAKAGPGDEAQFKALLTEQLTRLASPLQVTQVSWH